MRIENIKKLTAALFVTLLLAACQTAQVIETGPDAKIIDGNLHKVDNSRSQLTYVEPNDAEPNADFSKYNGMLLDPLGVDNVDTIQPCPSVGRAGQIRAPLDRVHGK